jgi:FlaG/FlaF family flagellin (archaellin)
MKQNAAVSPVIGIILMIALTLIIAAVVSSFAGGMIETREKIPTVTFEAKFSQASGLSLLYLSGEPLPLSMLTVRLTPSETFGIDAKQDTRIIDKTAFQDKDGKKWVTDISVMKVGDKHYVKKDDLSTLDPTGSTYKVAISDSVNKTFYLEIYYQNNLISKQKVLIEE